MQRKPLLQASAPQIESLTNDSALTETIPPTLCLPNTLHHVWFRSRKLILQTSQKTKGGRGEQLTSIANLVSNSAGTAHRWQTSSIGQGGSSPCSCKHNTQAEPFRRILSIQMHWRTN